MNTQVHRRHPVASSGGIFRVTTTVGVLVVVVSIAGLLSLATEPATEDQAAGSTPSMPQVLESPGLFADFRTLRISTGAIQGRLVGTGVGDGDGYQ